jgi:hypothetical protein
VTGVELEGVAAVQVGKRRIVKELRGRPGRCNGPTLCAGREVQPGDAVTA